MFERSCGTSRYVDDEIGYAPSAFEFRLLVVGLMGNVSPCPAALIDDVEGATKSELFLPLMLAKPSCEETAYWYSTYPAAACVWLMHAATPELPFPPLPTGHATDLSAPTCLDHVGLSWDNQLVKMKVVPEESARWQIWIGSFGSFTPLLSFAIAGSFHFLIFPRKTSAIVGPSMFRGALSPFTL